jgi:hypothetical protein
MSGTPILGPIAFKAFEVPERIGLGGRQSLAVHVLPGGGRVVDAMGPDEAPIRWAGMFSGEDAAERVRLLERLRRAGDPLQLFWDGWRYSVIIQDFSAEVSSPWWIPYRIELCVLPEAAVSAIDPVLASTLTDAIALGAGPDIDGRIEASAAGLSSSDLGLAISAAGSVAQLVAARAFAGKMT